MKDNKYLHFLKTEMRTQKTTLLIYTLILAVLSASLISIVALTVEMPDELTEFACGGSNLINVDSTDPAVFRVLEDCPVTVEECSRYFGDIEGLLLQDADVLKIMGREDLAEKLYGESSEKSGEKEDIEGEMFEIPILDSVIMLNIDPDDQQLKWINSSVVAGEPYTGKYNHELFLWISEELADYRNLHVGDVISVPYNAYSGKKVSHERMQCVIKGILGHEEDYIFPTQCVMTYEVGRRLQGPVPFQVVVRVKSILQYNNVITKLRSSGAMVYFGFDPEMTENDSVTGYIYLLYCLFGVNVLVLLMFVSVLIMLVRMYVGRRTRFFAMLRTVGMSGRDCMSLIRMLFAFLLTAAFVIGFGLSPLIVKLVNDVFGEQFIECSLSASPLRLRNLGLYVGLLILTALIVRILTAKIRRSEIVAGLRREL